MCYYKTVGIWLLYNNIFFYVNDIHIRNIVWQIQII